MKRLVVGLLLALAAILVVGCGSPLMEELALVTVAEKTEATIAQCERVASGCSVSLETHVDQRPRFGFENRVLSVEEIEVGETYVRCNVKRSVAEVYTVISEPYTHTFATSGRTSWAVDVLVWRRGSDRAYRGVLFLTDVGVVSYPAGWNPMNVLLRLLPPK